VYHGEEVVSFMNQPTDKTNKPQMTEKPISGSISLGKSPASPAPAPASALPPRQNVAPTTSTQATSLPPTKPPTGVLPPKDAGSSKPPAFQVKQSPLRFLIPGILVLVMIALVIFAVSWVRSRLSGESETETSAPTQAIQLTYWGLWEPTQVVSQVLADFERNNPGIKVTYEQQSHKDYRERLMSRLEGGAGPDVFRFHNTWVIMLQDYLESMPDSVMSKATFDSTFYPVAVNSLTTQKGIVGVPLMYDGLGLYYNKAIFKAAGKTPPMTWEELRRTANQLTLRDANGAIQRAGVAMGTTANVDNWSDILGLLMLQNGADLSKPNSNLGRDSLTFYTIFSKQDKIWDDTLPASHAAFALEKVAMILAPSWRAHDIKAISQTIDFAIAPAPQLSGGEINWASFWAEGVSNKSNKAKQEAGWKLLKYLSDKEVMRQFYTQASTVRAFGEPFSRTDLADQLTGDPLVGAYISGAPTAKSWYMASRTFDNGINDKIIKYYEDAINAVNTGADETEALMTVEQGITQVYSTYAQQ
jgi:multiple sugar transport system substrate-binding protein